MSTQPNRRIGADQLAPPDPSQGRNAASYRPGHLAPVPNDDDDSDVTDNPEPPESEQHMPASSDDEVESDTEAPSAQEDIDELTGTPLRPPGMHEESVGTPTGDIMVIHQPLIPPYPIAPGAFTESAPPKWHNFVTHRYDQWLDRQFIVNDADWRRAFRYYRELIWSYYSKMSIVACVVHGKGGAGKTPTITNLAAATSIACGHLTVLYDNNPDYAGATGRSGLLEGETVTHEELLEMVRRPDFNLNMLSSRMQPTRHRVLVVAADADEQAHKVTPDQIREIIKVLRHHSRAVFVDLGTNITGPNNAVVHEMSDVLVFPMRTTSGLHTINGPVDGRNSTHKKLVSLSMKDPDDPHQITKFKANNALTVALGIRPDDDVAAFQDIIGRRNAMTVIPYDEAAAADQAVWHPVGDEPLHDVPLRASANTALAWLRAVAMMYQQAFKVRDYINSINPSTDTPTT